MSDKLYWIDTDPGVDDAIAILWAINNNFNIVGCSAVAGNLGLNTTYTNLCALLEYKNSDIKPYYGASCACLGSQFNASDVHGISLGPITIEKKYEFKEHVFNGLINFFENNKNSKLNIITLGPLTNISTFLIHFPKYKERIECIYMMGGGSYGNITAYGEFNIYSDVEAAYFLFNQGIDIVISDLDITDHYAYLSKTDFDNFIKNNKIDEWAHRILKFILERNPSLQSARVYDVLPFIYIKYPEFFKYDEVTVDIQLAGKSRGLTYYDYESKRENNVMNKESNLKKVKRLVSIDNNKYVDLLLNSFLI